MTPPLTHDWGEGHVPRRNLLIAAAMVAVSFVSIAPADAGLLPPPLRTETSLGAAPPPALWVAEGEDLLGGNTRLTDASAHGRAIGRTSTEIFAPNPLGPGSYRVVAQVRGTTAGTRLDLTTGHQMVGSWQVPERWVQVSAVVHQPDAGHPVGVAVYSPPGGAMPSIDVDWIALQATPPGFTVRGTDVLDPGGNKAVLHGVNRMGYHRWTHGGTQFNDGEHEAVHVERWGADVVRIHLNQEYWLTDCPAYEAPHGRMSTYRNVIASEVEAFTSRGVYTILDLHQVGGGLATRCLESAARGLKPMADSKSPEFWRSVAEAMRDNPLVGFDLFNEPHDIDDDTWRDGGVALGPLAYQVTGMQELYEAVRSTGAQNLIFVSGVRWATDIDVAMRRPLNGYGIVLAPHLYCHDNGCTSSTVENALQSAITDRALARHPVLITEFGDDDPSSGEFQQWAVRYAQDRGIGWVAYAWHDNPTDSAGWGLLQSLQPSVPLQHGVLTYPANVAGRPIWDSLAANRAARGYG